MPWVQCDAIKRERLENVHFSRGNNFWTNDPILILEIPTRPCLCLAKFIVCSEPVWTRGS